MSAANGYLSYTRAYERIISRREAFASAEPYSMVVLGSADSFVFQEGTLAYIQNENVHILDLYNDVGTQFVGAVPVGLEAAVNRYGASELNFPGGKVLIQFSEYEAQVCAITRLSGEYSQVSEPSWTPEFLHMPAWFRLSEDFVVCGDHSGIGDNSHHEWVIQVFNRVGVDGRANVPDLIQLERFFGVDVGQTVAFEIFDGYFYAISNTSSPEVEEIDWTSYYHCYRFPLNNANRENLQYTQIWRRQHREGPINDSWTSLSLQKDEGTGKVIICEARREWKNASSTQERTFYLQPIHFDDLNIPTLDDEHVENEDDGQDPKNASDGPQTQDSMGPSNASTVRHPSNPPIAAYPAHDVLVSAIDETNKPLYEPSKARPPRSYHPEFPSSRALSSKQKTYILTNTKHRSYNLASSAFLDVVTEDSKRVFNTAQIFLRIGSRSLDSPLDGKTGLLRKPLVDKGTGETVPHSEECFRDRGIHFWPPPNAPPELLDILQIKGSTRKVEAIADERSIILAIGTGPAKKLVLVNFDPEIEFPGLDEMVLPRSGKGEGEDTSFSEVILQQNRGSGFSSDNKAGDGKGKKRANPEVVSDNDSDDEMGTGGKKRVKSEFGTDHDDGEDETMLDATGNTTGDNEGQQENWLTTEPAEWKSIGKGFRFVYQ